MQPFTFREACSADLSDSCGKMRMPRGSHHLQVSLQVRPYDYAGTRSVVLSSAQPRRMIASPITEIIAAPSLPRLRGLGEFDEVSGYP